MYTKTKHTWKATVGADYDLIEAGFTIAGLFKKKSNLFIQIIILFWSISIYQEMTK